MLSVKTRLTREGAKLPEFKTVGAVGADLHAVLNEPVFIPAGQRAIIPTGISVEIPQGYEIQIRPRSGMAAKYGVTVLNTPGTIDADYRGEIMIILYNSDFEDTFTVRSGDRIAQAVIAVVPEIGFELVTDDLSVTDRGEGGFGSTGV